MNWFQRTRKLVLLCGVLLCAAAPGFSQRYSYRLYGQAEGLSNLVPQCVLQDHLGFLWVGTQNGLFRYDGSRFRAFGRADGLPNSRIISLHESPDGTVWVGTLSGLVRRVGDRFEPLAGLGSLRVIHRQAIASDSAGNVYVATDQGLVTGHKEGSAWKFQKFAAQASADTQSVYAEPGGPVWLGCSGRICSLENGKLRIHEEAPAGPWLCFRSNLHGELWALSRDEIWRRKKGTSVFEPFTSPDTSLQTALVPLLGDPNLELDGSGNPLATGRKGLYRWTGARWELLDAKSGLTSTDLSVIFRDREGSLWIGFAGLGLARWLGYGEWEGWTESEGLPQNSIWSIQRDFEGNLWVGTSRGFAMLPAGSSGTWQRQSELAGSMVLSILPAGPGKLWVGTGNDGLWLFDTHSHKLQAVTIPNAGIQSDQVFADRKGQFWISLAGGLFRTVLPEDGDQPQFQLQQIPGSTERERFRRVLEDRKGRIWGAGANGLAMLENGVWRRFTAKDGIEESPVYSLAEAPDGAIWVGYQDAVGLSRVNWQAGKLQIEHVGMRDGMLSDQSVFLGFDARGWLWVGTDNGVDIQANGVWKHYGQADGLVWDDCNSRGFYNDTDGSVWIGTSRGLSRFRPVERVSLPPPVVVTAAELGSKDLLPGGIKIPWSGGAFKVGFAALTFLNEREVSYRYRLRGVDKEWVESTQPQARYVALGPGDYTFEVLARNAHGVWSPQPAQLAFTILTPWWRSWWAESLFWLTLAGLGLLAWKRRVARELREVRRLETAVEQRTQELEREKLRAEEASKLKGEFLANISHEIRTPLNAILGMTQLVLGTRLDGEQTEYLEITKSSAYSLLEVLNGILDFSKIEAGRLEIEKTPFALRSCVRDAVRTLQAQAVAKGLTLEVAIDQNVPGEAVGDPLRLRQIMLNLLSNAVKFTQTGGVRLEAGTVYGQDDQIMLTISVIDSGIGIDAEKQKLVFEPFRQADGSTTRQHGGTGLGLAICQSLVELMGGTIWLESAAGHGSAFRFRIPLRRTIEAISLDPIHLPLNHSKRVLLAEDNLVNQKLVVRLLEKQGHQVTVVNTGWEALQAAERERFDLILMDVQMPEMDGLTATRLLRSREHMLGWRAPVLAMTAYALDGDRERCMEAGMDGYLSKPVQAEKLLDAVANAAGMARSE